MSCKVFLGISKVETAVPTGLEHVLYELAVVDEFVRSGRCFTNAFRNQVKEAVGRVDPSSPLVVAIDVLETDEIGTLLEIVDESIEELVVIIGAIERYPVVTGVKILSSSIVTFVGIA
ncbi:hypothetical protein [Natrarchaeobius halalkaliphilus]|uniref:hypothetical protein n=1 Tax=Natrarchaeobius halalkaliphilus TaxID=1679091 RepID=UPI000F538DB7|nr:hypothetical protein [Natrarchaeobius halalkaliphilus]